MRIFVYYNIHKKCLSLRATAGPERGRVVLHAQAVELENVYFKVSKAGRARVLTERAKNVHAGMTGELCSHLAMDATPAHVQAWEARRSGLPGCDVTYNPYRWESFVESATEAPVHQAERCIVVDKRIRATPVAEPTTLA